MSLGDSIPWPAPCPSPVRLVSETVEALSAAPRAAHRVVVQLSRRDPAQQYGGLINWLIDCHVDDHDVKDCFGDESFKKKNKLRKQLIFNKVQALHRFKK